MRVNPAASVILIGSLISCNLLSVVMAKVVASRFPMEANARELAILLGLTAIWGSSYLARLVLWLIVGKRFQLSYVYPILEINFFLAYVVGIAFWGEAFSWRQVGGLALICAGILVIVLSPNRYTAERGRKAVVND